jgi:uncharacterized protein YoxC
MSTDRTSEVSSEIDPLSIEAAGVSSTMSAQPLERFASCFEKSARRWEMVVYPALFAFCVLSIYGFYMIYHLTQDMSHIARNIQVMSTSIDPYMGPHLAKLVDGVENMSSNVQVMTRNLNAIDGNMATMTVSMEDMNGSMGQITGHMQTLEPMMASMNNMDQATQHMANSTLSMTREMGSMNRGFSPRGMFSRFSPF